MRIQSLAIAACLAALPLAAFADEPWVGWWAISEGECDQTSDGNVHYAPAEVDYYASSCVVTGSVALTVASAWVVDMTCSSEGETAPMQELLMVDGEGQLHTFREGWLATRVRCPRPFPH